LKATSQIVLNSLEIEFQEATVSSGGTTQTAKVTLDKEKEMATLGFDKTIQSGPASVHNQVRRNPEHELRGLYLGKDKDGRNTRRRSSKRPTHAALSRRSMSRTTKLPSTSPWLPTRRTRDLECESVVRHTRAGRGEAHREVRDHGENVVLPGRACSGEFEYVKARPRDSYSCVGTPGTKQDAAFALEVAEQCVKYFNHYFASSIRSRSST